MIVFLRVMCVVVVVGSQHTQDTPRAPAEMWNHIRSLARENPSRKNPELVEYLKSLIPGQMLDAARYAWEECSRDPQFDSDEDRLDACGSGMMICLEYYLDKCDPKTCVTGLLDIARDRTECFALRYAIVASMSNAGARYRFSKELPSYVKNHLPQTEMVLAEILQNQREEALLRGEALQTLASLLREQTRIVFESDPRIRQALEEKRGHTDKDVNVDELIRAGEVPLTEETLKGLEPVEARTIAYVKLLGAILADEENEPEDIQKQAKRRLEGYRKSALTGIADEVEKAIQQAGN